MLKNWKNFQHAEWYPTRQAYVIGPNASGKSNLLDAFLFLHDVCTPVGGGLQKAVQNRGGMQKLRSHHVRRDMEVRIDVHCARRSGDPKPSWRYSLGFVSSGRRSRSVMISHEEVWKDDHCLLSRPAGLGVDDVQRVMATYLEQTHADAQLRELVQFLAGISHLILVPVWQDLHEQIAGCRQRVRDSRLHKIAFVLSRAIPQIEALRIVRDVSTGRSHLEARLAHKRRRDFWMREDQLSHGTFRLIAIMWMLLDGATMLLLNEPESSLHRDVVAQLPHIIDRCQHQGKRHQQVIVSTHSETLLANKAIDPNGLAVLVPTCDGTCIRPPSAEERIGLEAGFSIADVVLPQTRTEHFDQRPRA